MLLCVPYLCATSSFPGFLDFFGTVLTLFLFYAIIIFSKMLEEILGSVANKAELKVGKQNYV